MTMDNFIRQLRTTIEDGRQAVFALFFLAFAFYAAMPALAQPGPSKDGQCAAGVAAEKGAIHIKSDFMEAMDQKGTVVFTGHVVAVRDDLTINSDRLEVFYSKNNDKGKAVQGDKNAGDKKAIDKIVATGHVRITKAGRVATAEKAVYDKRAEKITLTGSAQVWEGPNRVKGDTIILFINENRSIVQGSGSKKVEAVVYPSE